MRGKIIKGIAGLYYIYGENHKIYECKARGVFRKNSQKPLVGDNVEIDILDEKEQTGNIIRMEERKNALIRPAVANIDRALVIFALVSPKPTFTLLDRFLWMMEKEGIETGICFNKEDLAGEDEIARIRAIYEPSGYPLFFVSAKEETGLEEVKAFLRGKTTTVAGPSGVGKSSLINSFQSHITMETGALSKKLERGKHTTRHSELIPVEKDTYIMDTPGFSSLSAMHEEKETVKDYFREFTEYAEKCRFPDCMHIHEPDCGVKKALSEGLISESRYESYLGLYEEVQAQKKY